MRRCGGRALLAVTVLVATASACPRNGSTARDRRLEAWLFCDECESNERDSAATLGNAAVPVLEDMLRQLPDEWAANLGVRYGRAAARIGLTGADSADYVERFLGNFAASVASRSAITLGDIATPQAIDVLRAALADSAARGYRADVIRDLQQSLARATSPPVVGTWPGGARRFLDTVWIARTSGRWDTDETVSLVGGPFPDDVGVGFRGGNTELGFVAAATPGDYAFTVRNVGSSQETQQGTLQITRFPGPRVTTVRDVTAEPLPIISLMALTRRTTPPDPARMFRFAPAADLTVTATADWPGPATIALVWDACQSRGSADVVTSTISGQVLEPKGQPSAGAQVTLQGTAIGGVTNKLGNFIIPNVPRGFSGTIRARKTGFSVADLAAWSGATGVVLWLGDKVVSNVTTGPSGISAGRRLPSGTCSVLTVLRTDTTTAPAIVRLRVTSP